MLDYAICHARKKNNAYKECSGKMKFYEIKIRLLTIKKTSHETVLVNSIKRDNKSYFGDRCHFKSVLRSNSVTALIKSCLFEIN